MKKKVLSLMASGLLMLPMVGCNANLSVGGKEIFNFNDTQPEQYEEYQYEQEDEVIKDEILARLLVGEYTLYINEDEYVYNTEEVLKALYDGNPQYKVEKYVGTQYSVQVSDVDNKNFVTFLVDEIKEDIAIAEFNHNGEFFEGQDASDNLSYVIYSELFNEEDATLTKKQYTTKEDTKKEQEKENIAKEEKKRKKLDTVCAYCQKQMYEDMLSSSHEDSFCSVNCQDKWYQEQREMNENKYNCLWCNGAMNQYQYDTYGGCCSELCAVQYEGMIYENAERNGEVGGQTLCGWCEIPIPDDQCFCSKECKNMHEEYYNN